VGLPNWQIDMDNNVLEGALREAQYTYEELVSQGRHDEATEATQIIRNMQVAPPNHHLQFLFQRYSQPFPLGARPLCLLLTVPLHLVAHYL